MVSQQIKTQIRVILDRFLPAKSYQAFIFGSRARGDNSRWSDIDLGLIAQKQLPGHLREKIREALENSRIPFKVDLVDFHQVSADFKKVALKKIIPL